MRQNGIVKRWFVMAALAVGVAFSGFVSEASAATLEVGASKPYATITGAVAAASAGDTVLVYSGIYTEMVTIASAKTNLTVQSAPGEAPVVSPTNALAKGFDIQADGVTVQGFEITGSNIVFGIVISDAKARVQILTNTIHDLRTTANGAGIICAIFFDRVYDAVIAGNTIRDLRMENSGTYGSAIWQSVQTTSGTLTISNNTIYALAFTNDVSTFSSGILLRGGTGSVSIVNNDISEVKQTQNNGVLCLTGNGYRIQNNRIRISFNGYLVPTITLTTSTNAIINNNYLASYFGAFMYGTSTTNIIFVNNTILNPFRGVGVPGPATYQMWLGWNPGAYGWAISNNVMVNYDTAISVGGNTRANRIGANAFFSSWEAYGNDDNVTAPSNVWNGNFYGLKSAALAAGTNYATGKPSPFTIAGAAANVDSAALPGYLTAMDRRSNQAAQVAGHTNDFNGVGARTKITYDTTRGAFPAGSNVAYFIHILSDTRNSLAGLPAAQTNHLLATLRVAHTLLDGQFFATIQVAYDPTNAIAMDKTRSDLVC